MSIIYHIVDKTEFLEAVKTGCYIPGDFDKDGYIHCSYVEQICPIADMFYSDKTDLFLLKIDPSATECEVKDEDFFKKGDFYPHIYGSLPISSVIKTHQFEKGEDGFFKLPDTIKE
jgi:uncharacterized protein (DUF952 family)